MRTRILIPLVGFALLTGCTATPPAEASGTSAPTKKPASAVRSVFGHVDVAISDAQSDAHFKADYTEPDWNSCMSDVAGFSDVDAGAQVTVTNAAGEVIGIGELEAGEFGFTSKAGATCKFPFVIEKVPLAGDFFGVQIGNEVRGTTQFTLREMQIGPYLYLGW